MAEGEIEGLAERGGAVAHLVLDRPLAFQQVGARHGFLSDIDADGRSERRAVVQHAQEAALVAAIVEHRRRHQVATHRDVDHAPPDRRVSRAHRLFVGGIAIPGRDSRGPSHGEFYHCLTNAALRSRLRLWITRTAPSPSVHWPRAPYRSKTSASSSPSGASRPAPIRAGTSTCTT